MTARGRANFTAEQLRAREQAILRWQEGRLTSDGLLAALIDAGLSAYQAGQTLRQVRGPVARARVVS